MSDADFPDLEYDASVVADALIAGRRDKDVLALLNSLPGVEAAKPLEVLLHELMSTGFDRRQAKAVLMGRLYGMGIHQFPRGVLESTGGET